MNMFLNNKNYIISQKSCILHYFNYWLFVKTLSSMYLFHLPSICHVFESISMYDQGKDTWQVHTSLKGRREVDLIVRGKDSLCFCFYFSFLKNRHFFWNMFMFRLRKHQKVIVQEFYTFGNFLFFIVFPLHYYMTFLVCQLVLCKLEPQTRVIWKEGISVEKMSP